MPTNRSVLEGRAGRLYSGIDVLGRCFRYLAHNSSVLGLTTRIVPADDGLAQAPSMYRDSYTAGTGVGLSIDDVMNTSTVGTEPTVGHDEMTEFGAPGATDAPQLQCCGGDASPRPGRQSCSVVRTPVRIGEMPRDLVRGGYATATPPVPRAGSRWRPSRVPGDGLDELRMSRRA